MSQRPHTRRGNRSAPRKPRAVPAGPPIEVVVDAIGARGDGIARSSDGDTLFIPDTAPGDRVIAAPGASRGDGRAARLVEILTSGPDRVAPACRHATICGGCVLQHLSAPAIADIKRGHLVDALARRGLPVDTVAETRSVPPGARRRIRLSAHRTGKRPVLGFNQRASAHLVDIAECPVTRPEITALLPDLHDLVLSLNSLGKGGDIQLTLSATGVDAVFFPLRDSDPDLSDRRRLAEFAEAHDLARIAWHSGGFTEPVASRRTPMVQFGNTLVEMPAGSFLQPSMEGEAILVDLVRQSIPASARSVADLYAGCGSLSVPLAAAGVNIHAVEGETAPVEAMRRAAGALRLQAECRDLARNPLSVAELNRFDAVILDPPRAGAAEQADMLSDSTVPVIVAVSCNPATLARDLRIMVDGGYTLGVVTPVDQFTWSGHLEAVAVLHRS